MKTIGSILERNARFYSGFEAIIYEERRWTYAQFYQRALRLGSALYGLGLRRQERVGILAMNCLEYYELYAACEITGFLPAPVNFRLAAPEIAWILSDASPRILLFEAQYAEVVDRLREQLDGIDEYVCIGQESPPWAHAYEALLDAGNPGGAPLHAKPDDFAYLFYTSGTTGRPKGVVQTHANMLDTIECGALAAEIVGGSRVLQVTPAFHCGGKGYVNNAFFAGGTVVLHRQFDPIAVLETIHRERITFTFMVAAMLQAVLDVENLDQYDTSSVRKIISAAAPIPLPLLRRGIERFGPVFGIQYGSTEAGTICNMWTHELKLDGTPEEVARLASVGHEFTCTELRIVDEQGNDCPVGTTGEVIVQTPGNLTAYWNNSIATLNAIRDGWYYTGDMGYRDEAQYVYLVDRKKDMIISGGENIYSREVEIAVCEHPAVVDCAVIGVPDPKWVESVRAVCVLAQGQSATEEELIEHCRQLIARYKCPKSVVFVDELPRLASGKVNKVELRKDYAA